MYNVYRSKAQLEANKYYLPGGFKKKSFPNRASRDVEHDYQQEVASPPRRSDLYTKIIGK